ncbi:aminodeoxyfutalosine deaminase [Methylacidimicrobium cyclopophantes]|uniref:Aminodeoxyfutalosine deaminase n=1 Tax=Methylacidimicrobium cyclopophantes TaxID=1041766 RepID=A0A5E6M6J2_9BACT|nr:amidohydrolase family protein [Methylacidimicrobium cyclopophantes]VVM04977.1 aminodeoxyfutalosine deaminase [Methylacidimicrobium cyclopophantes]
MLLTAKAVLLGSGEVLTPGTVRVLGNRIVDVAEKIPPRLGEERIALGDAVLSPGLINAHVHLDYTGLRGKLPASSFPAWVKEILRHKASLSLDSLQEALHEGFGLLARSGTTGVANMEAYPELLLLADRFPLRCWWFLELLDIRPHAWSAEATCAVLRFFDNPPLPLGKLGLAPHAPYTTSPELYRLVRESAHRFLLPVTTHVAESPEEWEMFHNGEGALWELVRQAGEGIAREEELSPLQWLHRSGGLAPGMILVHLNYLDDADWALLANKEVSVVHCPKSHAFFSYAPFPLERMLSFGIPVCLATDSLASNDTLDLREEIREARRRHPAIRPMQWWEMVTAAPARALGFPRTLGVIRSGAWADLAAFRWVGGSDPWEACIESQEEPLFLMVHGNVLKSEGRWHR